jgi:hypothetical protein
MKIRETGVGMGSGEAGERDVGGCAGLRPFGVALIGQLRSRR